MDKIFGLVANLPIRHYHLRSSFEVNLRSKRDSFIITIYTPSEIGFDIFAEAFDDVLMIGVSYSLFELFYRRYFHTRDNRCLVGAWQDN